MDVVNDFRSCDTEQIVVPFEILPVVRQFCVPEVFLFQAMSLDHCTHSAIDYKNTFAQFLFQEMAFLRCKN